MNGAVTLLTHYERGFGIIHPAHLGAMSSAEQMGELAD